jgi:hypothetical protein
MMDSGIVRNMWSTLSNKCEKQWISLAIIIRIYHDAWSSECQRLYITDYSFHKGVVYWYNYVCRYSSIHFADLRGDIWVNTVIFIYRHIHFVNPKNLSYSSWIWNKPQKYNTQRKNRGNTQQKQYRCSPKNNKYKTQTREYKNVLSYKQQLYKTLLLYTRS